MATKKPKGLGLGLEALLGPTVRDTPPDAVKKLHIVPGFECRNRAADGGLGKIEGFRRPGHMLALGHRQKNPELVKCHEMRFPGATLQALWRILITAQTSP